VRALSPARTRRFDSCQVQLETRSTIFAVGRHFVQGAPFAIPTAPGADLSDRLRARVPSEVTTETLLCRCSYGQAVQSGIKLPLRGDSLWISQWRYENSKCVRSLCDCAQFFGAHCSRLSIGQTVAQENCAFLIKFGEVDSIGLMSGL
jgi:hypothetical protein